MSKPSFIPRPLVRTNQWVIVLSVVAAWATGFHSIMFIPLLAGLLGIVFGFNPIMRFAKLFLRKAPSEYTPEDPGQQRFNQIVAISCLSLSLGGFYIGWSAVGYVFSIMVALSAFVAILGFCVGCFIRFQWSQYRYRRSLRSEC